MSAKHLAARDNWQQGARITGDAGENDFVKYLAPCLKDYYGVILKPPKIVLYGNEKGINLDSAITNHRTGRGLFIEKKSGTRGGNAHERVYKYMSPALKEHMRMKYNTAEDPFFFVFSGPTFSGPVFYTTSPKGARTKVDPQKYQDELNLLLRDENYAIVKENYINIQEIANQIMEII